MTVPVFDEIVVGSRLPPVEMPPLTRQTLAIYCGASGDHNPVHVDIDFARDAGLDDVIAHGMLIMAYAGRVLTQWVPQSAISQFDTRFLAMTRIGDAITASAEVTEKFTRDGHGFVRVAVETSDQHGEVKTRGEAIIDINKARLAATEPDPDGDPDD